MTIMASITLTAAMRANLLSLQNTADLLGRTQFRLATGNKINSALDSPTAYFAAQSLSNRASDLSTLLDGMTQAVQIVKAADEGIKGLTKLVEQAQSIAQTAQSQASGGALYTGTVSITAANQASLTAALAANNDTFTVRLGTGPTTTFTIGTGQTLASLVDQMNAISGLSVTTIADTANAGNVFVQIRTTNGQSVTIANGTNTPATAIFGAGSIATHAATTVAPTDRVALENQYNTIRTQIDQFIVDTGYRGKNLLGGDTATVQFNEANSSKLTVVGTKRDAAGLGLLAAGFGTTGNIQTNLDQIKTALATLRTDATLYGNNLSVIQTRSDFTGNLVNVLKDGATSLTIADKNEEGANLLALQTSQQLGIQALALASQANQSVLRLFG
jgi:flagellin